MPQLIFFLSLYHLNEIIVTVMQGRGKKAAALADKCRTYAHMI